MKLKDAEFHAQVIQSLPTNLAAEYILRISNDFLPEEINNISSTKAKKSIEFDAENKILEFLELLNRNRHLISYDRSSGKNVYYNKHSILIKVSYFNELLGVNHHDFRKSLLALNITRAFNNRGKKVDYKVYNIDNDTTYRCVLINREYWLSKGFDFDKR